MNCLITDSVPEYFISKLEALNFKVDYKPEMSQEECKRSIPDYEILVVRNSIKVDAELIELGKELKYILRPGSGLENVNLEKAKSREIGVYNSPEGNCNAVAEHAMGLLLSYSNNIVRSFNQVQNKIWLREENRGFELEGKTVGIIGYGHTGSAFAEKLKSFKVQILAYDKYKSNFGGSFVKEVSLNRLQEESHIISLHLPYNKETHHFVNSEFCSTFINEVILLNTSRGKIIDSQSLLNSLQNGKIRAALLDVLENEDLQSYTAQERFIMEALIQTGRVIITPHIAGWSIEANRKMYDILLNKLGANYT